MLSINNLKTIKMIDTIKAYLNLNLNPVSEPITVAHFQSCLDNPKNTEGNKSVGYMSGYLKNIKVSLQYDIITKIAIRLTVLGSVPKFLFNNNIASCSPSDIQTFIDTISSALDIDVSMAIVSWLDFGLNFCVTRPVPDYITAINRYPRIHKSQYEGETVTFAAKSKSKVITFYDKIKEVKASKNKLQPTNIPQEFYDLNILRYEVRYRKQPYKKFKREKPIQLKDLTPNGFHKLLFEHLKATFQKVDIQELKFPTTDLAAGSGFLKTYLALIGLHQCGYENVSRIIESQEFNVKNPAVKRSTLKKQLKKLANLTNELQDSNIKTALEEKFDALEFIYY